MTAPVRLESHRINDSELWEADVPAPDQTRGLPLLAVPEETRTPPTGAARIAGTLVLLLLLGIVVGQVVGQLAAQGIEHLTAIIADELTSGGDPTTG